MDNSLSFSELVLKFWDTILQFIWPLYFRHEGFNIIKKSCGKPVKVYNNERWCWKWPLWQGFDVVDMREHVFNSTAHSFVCNIGHTIPYNIVIDTQVEFCIKNPLVIYKLNNDFTTNQVNPLYLFVSNQVHQLLSLCFNDPDSLKGISIGKLQDIVNTKLSRLSSLDKQFCREIKLNKIVITSYDYNISLRQIQ